MWSFEVWYVVVAQKINPLEGALYEKNCHISAPPINKLQGDSSKMGQTLWLNPCFNTVLLLLLFYDKKMPKFWIWQLKAFRL